MLMEIRSRWRELYPRDKYNGVVCPICGNGSGESGTGVSEWKEAKQRYYLKCFKCKFSGDVIELIEQEKHYSFVEAVEYAIERLNIDKRRIDKGRRNPKQQSLFSSPASTLSPAVELGVVVGGNTRIENNYQLGYDTVNMFLKINWALQNNLNETNYHLERGISFEICKRFGIFFVKEWRHPKSHNAPFSPRLIIPTSESSYLARDVRNYDDIPDEQKPYIKQKVGNSLFNAQALTIGKPTFIVEGEFDALSIEEVGGNALALGSTSNIRLLVDLLQSMKEAGKNIPILMIAMDNDEAGKNASESLQNALQAINIPSVIVDINLGKNDANEALIENREQFNYYIKLYMNNPYHDEEVKYLMQSDFFDSDDMINVIEGNREIYPTGFDNLDKLLDGGLFAGLYIIGAASSVGKTTFCVQMMDNIAQSGHDVIFFSLEMAKNELMAKAISRISMKLALQKFKSLDFACSTRDLLKGNLPKSKNGDKRMELVRDAFEIRNQYSKRIFTKVGTGDIGVKEIRETVQNHVDITHNKPVIFIDYIQMLSSSSHMTDKQAVDKNIMELKRISRDFDIPVIGISSFNRDSYNVSVNLASFKESGAIEYSSDVLMGLQYGYISALAGETAAKRQERIEKAQRENHDNSAAGKPVSIELKVLKNRNGAKGRTNFNFWERYNFFEATIK